MGSPRDTQMRVPVGALMTRDGAADTSEGRGWELHCGDALDAYPSWPAPAAIISDGAYGVGGFRGDPPVAKGLAKWYEPHVAAWTEGALPLTTLWFWNTEIGWATVHPLLAAYGWEYVQVITWDKTVAHIAGNVNSSTIRQFPIVTEMCAFYRRPMVVPTTDGDMGAKRWLREEWLRSGIPLSEANRACGVANAASRKYLTSCWRWYPPPGDSFAAMVEYANLHGEPKGRPYFAPDGERVMSAGRWGDLCGGSRYRWDHLHGVTNVWTAPPLRNRERQKGGSGNISHPNQKPLMFMRRIIEVATRPDDVVWEPFGGLATAVVAAVETGRRGYAAEVDAGYASLAHRRLRASEDAPQRAPRLLIAEKPMGRSEPLFRGDA